MADIKLGSGDYIIKPDDHGGSTLYRRDYKKDPAIAEDTEIQNLKPNDNGSINFNTISESEAVNLRFTIYGLSPNIKEINFNTGKSSEDQLEIIAGARIASGININVKDEGGDNNNIHVTHLGPKGNVKIETGNGSQDKIEATAINGDISLTDNGGDLNWLSAKAIRGNATSISGKGDNDFTIAETNNIDKIAITKDLGGTGNMARAINPFGTADASTGEGKHDKVVAQGKDPTASDSGGDNEMVSSHNSKTGELTTHQHPKDTNIFIEQQLKNPIYHSSKK